jgi:RNA polymerase sigma-70 factor (ECF subfamily)
VLIDELRKRPPATVSIDDVEAPAHEKDDIDCSCVLAQAAHLKPEYAFILKRVVIDGVPATQFARDLGVTANTAMVRLHRARAALKRRLREHCGTTNLRSCSDCGCEERGCCAAP